MVLAPLLTAASRLRWLPTLAGAALVEGEAGAALGDVSGACDAFTRALDLATRHGLAGVERDARTALAELR